MSNQTYKTRNKLRKAYGWSCYFILLSISGLLLLSTCRKLEPIEVIKVITDTITEVQYTSCIVEATVIRDASWEITQHGFCWAETENPTTSDFRVNLGGMPGGDNFSDTLTALEDDTQYYLRAFVVFEGETIYSNQKSFHTLAYAEVNISTLSVTSITDSSAHSGGNIIDAGGASVFSRGVCWNTTGTPTTEDAKTENGSGTGQFTSELNSLIAGTTYYLRAYAITSEGEAYGNEVSFTTDEITWARAYGGTLFDYRGYIDIATDGGYYIGCVTDSYDGDISENIGGSDYWVAKLNKHGNIKWSRVIGGGSTDIIEAVRATSDNGCIVAGRSFSSDGNVSTHYGGADIWVAKLDADGGLDWEKTLGGSEADYANDIIQTADGGFLVVGETRSTDYDVSSIKGTGDAWAVKLSSAGEITWDLTFGGYSLEAAYAVKQIADNGYIICGQSSSNDDFMPGNNGGQDFMIVKLTQSGSLDWRVQYGGAENDAATDILQTSDGGFIVAGWTNSNDGDVTNHQGNADVWLIRLSSTGSLQWQKTFGSADNEYGYSLDESNTGGYVITGLKDDDYWILDVSAQGSLVSETAFGGSGADRAYTIKLTEDNGYIISGEVNSGDGDVEGNHGNTDMWVVKTNTEFELNSK